MRIWTTESNRGSRLSFGQKRILGLILIVTAMLALTIGTTLAVLHYELPNGILLANTLIVTICVVFVCNRLGTKTLADTIIFIEDDYGNLFLVSAEIYKHYTGNQLLSYVASGIRSDRNIKSMIQEGGLKRYLTEGGDPDAIGQRIYNVIKIKPYRSGNYVHCYMRDAYGRRKRRTLVVESDYVDYELLMSAFRRHMTSAFGEDAHIEKPNRNPFHIVVSSLLFLIMLALCVLSHPAVGLISSRVYFIFLALAFISFYFPCYFIVKEKRGE